MSLRVVTLAALAALVLGASPAVAQTAVAPGGADPFAPGMRLRITAATVHRGRLVGRVIRHTADSLEIDTVEVSAERRMFFPVTVLVTKHRRVALPLAAIDSLQVSSGRSRARGMVRLATRAAVIGGVALGFNYMSGTRRPSLRNFSEGFRTGAVLAASLAAPVGFHMGRERWTPVRGRPAPERPARDPRIVAEASP